MNREGQVRCWEEQATGSFPGPDRVPRGLFQWDSAVNVFCLISAQALPLNCPV